MGRINVRKIIKIMLWLLGLMILLYLISFPIHKTEHMWGFSPLPLSGKVIVLDPGHGGPDGGAKGADNTNEKEIVLVVAKTLRDYLQQAGALVYLTREKDEDLASESTKGFSARKS